MLEPLKIPAAWQGDEVWRRPLVRQSWTPHERSELREALVAVEPFPLEEITPERFQLPTLSSRMAAVARELEEGAGIVLLRGLPLAELDDNQAARLFWGLMGHLGTPVPQTADGRRLFHVRDEGYADDDPRARGPSSRRPLSFHTDRCDVIAFLCVRPARRGGENEVVSSVALYNRLLAERPDLLETLLQPYYYQRHNVDPGNELPYYRQPIFTLYEGKFAASLLRVLIERAYRQPDIPAMSTLQRQALDQIEMLAADPQMHVRFRQEAGDIVLLNNFVTLHRRTEFEDYTDPQYKRHLIRLWLSVPNSRALDPRLAPTYGATSAGALRGGMRPLRMA